MPGSRRKEATTRVGTIAGAVEARELACEAQCDALLSDGLWWWDEAEPELIRMNRDLWTRLGRDPDWAGELCDEWSSLVDIEDLRRVRDALAEVARGASRRLELCLRFHGEEETTLWLECRGVRDPNVRGCVSGCTIDVSANKQAEECRRRWQHVFDSAGWGIIIGSRDGRKIEAVNPAFARMHGYEVKELIGAPIAKLFAADALPGLCDAINRSHAEGHHSFESRHVRKDGSVFPVSINVTAVKDPIGLVLYRAVHVEDLSNRVESEEARRADSISRDVLDRLLEGCQVIGFDWTYLYLNDATELQSRKRKDELLGRTMMECYPGIEQTGMFNALRQCMESRLPGRMENEFNFEDGTRLVFELRFVPVPQGVCVLSLDITARRHRLSAIVDDSEDAIIGRTADGVVTNWNRSAERIFGHAASEIVGKRMRALIPPELAAETAEVESRVLAGERNAHFETVRLRSTGDRFDASVAISAVRDTQGVVIGVSEITRDITELKQLQRALMSAKEAAESMNRELESFSYSVAHDLRAPLRSINGFSQALLEDCADQLDDDGRRHLGFVRDSAQHMSELIDGLLKLSRLSRHPFEPIETDLSAMVRTLWTEMERGAIDRTVELRVAECMPVVADPRLIKVALENLLGNARKFTAKRPDARVEVGSTLHDGNTAFYVRDNGAGFDMKYASKLFGVFQRLHSTSEFEGTGIGLATVQRVIHRHGGRVWAEAEVGVGATIYFTLMERTA